MTSYFKRFRHHPLGCLSHILWGILAGILGGIDGTAFLAGGWAYQFGSGWRKSQVEGQVDTVGLDCVDYAIGYILAITLRVVLALEGVPLELPHLTAH